MSKHYEERYYSREEKVPGNYEEHRSTSRNRSSSRSRHHSQSHNDQYYRQRYLLSLIAIFFSFK